jgi:hypothetical protein
MSFLEMQSKRRNSTYALLDIKSSVQIGEQINVMKDVTGTAFSLKNNSTLNDVASDISSYSPTDVFLSVGYLQSQSLPKN